MRKSAFIISLVLLAVSSFVSCTHQQLATPSNPNGDNNPTNVDTGICFQRDILPIFVSNCAKSGCHDATTQAEELVLNSYSNIISGGIVQGKAAESELYKSLSGTNPKMPQYPNAKLSTIQQNIIKDWINQGAINSSCTSACDTTLYTYTAIIKPILATNCVGCHSSTSASAGVILDTYTGIQTVALNGRLLGAINGTAPYIPMPQSANKLMSCQITQITKWVNAGAPNN